MTSRPTCGDSSRDAALGYELCSRPCVARLREIMAESGFADPNDSGTLEARHDGTFRLWFGVVDPETLDPETLDEPRPTGVACRICSNPLPAQGD